ncbi:hypothetical protein PhCBS80983_g00546 [Powellomyces hirtus]|uniref:TraB domain-containing protein n=1 Tax=Powellomyces hirtus TaxID=109895 RepID=A0A507EEQ7_9FUNG|nr:hypothetical protein PhCBS80983_g00546 [Powellomyces hirtus]
MTGYIVRFVPRTPPRRPPRGLLYLLRPPTHSIPPHRFFSSSPRAKNVIDTSSPQYIQSNAEWSVLALDHPLVHNQTGIRVYIVGIHHNSPASLERVEQVIAEAQPVAVCLEVDSHRLRRFSAKAEIVLGQYRDQANESDATSATTSPAYSHRVNYTPPRLRGVRTVVQPNAAHTNSAAFTSLTDRDREVLSRLDMDPAHHLSATHIHYGLEMGVAIRAAYEHQAVIRAIDIHPDVLRSDPTHSALIRNLVQRYRLLPPPTRRTSALGRALFWLLTRASLGFRRNVDKEAEADISSVQDHATYLRCWKAFFPSAYFWWLEVRNAGMVDQLRACVRDVAQSRGLLDANGVRKTTREPPPTIVAVVGKSHVFGIAEMWTDVVASEKFPLVKNPVPFQLKGEEIISVEELISSTISNELPGARNASTGTSRVIMQHAQHERGKHGQIERRNEPSAPRRGGTVAPPPAPDRPPPRTPTGIRYID